MQLDIYAQETNLLTEKNASLLDEVKQRLKKGELLSNLEQAGTLHALQVLIENAIGKAKHTLKFLGQTVPVSAYDVFDSLAAIKIIPAEELDQWKAIVGLRNKIVHDYMNIKIELILNFVKNKQYQTIIAFLLQPIVRR